MKNYLSIIKDIRQKFDNTKPSGILRCRQGFARGFCVPMPFLACIRSQVSDLVPFLSERSTYTAKDLCHPEFWKHLNDGERRMADLCIDGEISDWLRIGRVNDEDDFPAKFSLITKAQRSRGLQ